MLMTARGYLYLPLWKAELFPQTWSSKYIPTHIREGSTTKLWFQEIKTSSLLTNQEVAEDEKERKTVHPLDLRFSKREPVSTDSLCQTTPLKEPLGALRLSVKSLAEQESRRTLVSHETNMKRLGSNSRMFMIEKGGEAPGLSSYHMECKRHDLTSLKEVSSHNLKEFPQLKVF